MESPTIYPSKTSNLYERLGLNSNATLDEIKNAYRKSALLWHPDKREDKLEAQVEFIAISESYEILSDEFSRNQYDLEHRVKDAPKTESDTERSERIKKRYEFYKNMFDAMEEKFPTLSGLNKYFGLAAIMAESFPGMDDLFRSYKKPESKEDKKELEE
ncbi:DnaJ domain-containing protein [Candidatus Woesearchaeota archaeon]|nr:DnaJ domain-containing protein [Candidatus Woesearchaeota archaeon]